MGTAAGDECISYTARWLLRCGNGLCCGSRHKPLQITGLAIPGSWNERFGQGVPERAQPLLRGEKGGFGADSIVWPVVGGNIAGARPASGCEVVFLPAAEITKTTKPF
jgi:hypothetical protein